MDNNKNHQLPNKPMPKAFNLAKMSGVREKDEGSRVEFKLDYNQLESDLQKELESDRLYWIQNDAKIRAVQGSGTYEDFRQKVLAAHLKPLEKKDTKELQPNSSLLNKVIWNKGINGPESDLNASSSPQPIPKSHKSKYADLLPKNIHEFKIQWKELTYSNTNTPIQIKLDYLKKLLEFKTLETLFKDEVPLEILPQLFELFAKILAIPELPLDDGIEVGMSKTAEAEDVLEILNIISGTKRFDFTKIFFTLEDTKNLEIIFGVGKIKAQNPKLMALLPKLKQKYLNPI